MPRANGGDAQFERGEAVADYFLYGGLAFAPLLEVVLGHGVDPAATRDAVLPNHKIVTATGAFLPLIAPASEGSAHGVTVAGLTDEDAQRLTYFAGVFDLAPMAATFHVDGRVVDGQAFAPRAPDTVAEAQAASQQDWTKDNGALAVFAAQEIMAQFGRQTSDEMAARRYPILVRAAQLARAAHRVKRVDPDRRLDDDVIVEARHYPYLNFFGIGELDLRHRRFDGSLSPMINRAALRVGDAAVVLPYDPKRDCVLLVQQFRPATYIAGDLAPWLWEAPAGLVDPGETPQQAAFREAEEEAKVRLDRLEPVTEAYSTTGSSTEYAYIYVGIADLSQAGSIAGLEAEGEDIRSEVVPFDAFMTGIEQGRYVNLHLLTVGYWLALNRDRLRAG